MPKSDETRARIRAAAIDLFRRNGFAQTTMREIASEAGVALGAASYYFDSKDATVPAFYDQAPTELEPLLGQALAGSRDLARRLRALLDATFHYFEPNRRLLGTLSAYAYPEHPLSPFSEQTRAIREREIRFFDDALAGALVEKSLMLVVRLIRLSGVPLLRPLRHVAMDLIAAVAE